MKKKAIVTGGSRGIGFAIAQKLKSLNYDVVIWHNDTFPTPGGKEFKEVIVDLQHTQSAAIYAVKETEKLWKKNFILDVLVNNAGVCQAKSFRDISLTEYDEIMDINLKAPFFITQTLLPWMRKNKSPNMVSNVINISSISGLQGFTGHSHYCASKFGLIGLTQVLAKELVGEGIAANAICPGPTHTDMWAKLDKEYEDMNDWLSDKPESERYYGKLMIKRLGEPEDIARAVEYILAGNYSTGMAMTVCGGNLLR